MVTNDEYIVNMIDMQRNNNQLNFSIMSKH